MSKFGCESTASEVMEGVELEGKVVVITGAYSGIGFETARIMGEKSAKVVVVGRNPALLEEKTAELNAMGLNGAFTQQKLDLSDLDSVREAATQLVKDYPKIDILINNAGVMACPFTKTKQGIEMQMGTNHFGHFLFTNLLMPSILAAGPGARIVNLSSRAHHFGDVDLDDINFEKTEYQKWNAYGRSKTANILFSLALDARLAPKGIHCIAVHPGVIGTNLQRHMDDKDKAFLKGLKFKSIPQGAATTCWAATTDEFNSKGGVYCEDCHIGEPAVEGAEGRNGVRAYAYNKDNSERLWKISEELVKQKFSF